MILLPTTRQRIARLPLLFRAHDCLDEQGLFALSYGKKVYAVSSRTGPATGTDQQGRHWRAAGGQARVGYSRTAAGLLVPSVLLERGATNACLRSQEFDNASWTKSGVTVTANARVAPDGTTTMDLLTSAGGVSSENVSQTVAFTGDGVKSLSVFLHAGSAAITVVSLYDNTAAVARHQVIVTWTAGVPSLSTAVGSGTLFPVEWHYGEGWRVAFTANSVVAANASAFMIYPAGTGTTAGSVYAWGAQAENNPSPTSYIPTTSAPASRSDESLYFPFAALPQAMTVYARLVNRGTFEINSARLWQLGDSDNGNPRLIALTSGGGSTRRVQGFHNNDVNADATSTPASAAITVGALLESRTVLLDDGAVQQAVALDGGAEVVGAASAAPAAGLPPAWGVDPRFYLSGQSSGLNAYTHLAWAPAQVSRDELRDLCEVA